jgi:hypothetical protein
MNDQLLIRDDSALQVHYTDAALALKEDALQSGALIGRVTNPQEQNAAVAAQKKIRNLGKMAESARVSAKAPVLEYGRRIDAAHAKFVKDLDDEEARITGLVSAFQRAEAQRVAAAERLRLQKEREIAEAAARAEAESRRKADEEAAKIEAERRKAETAANAAKNAEQRASAEAERQRLEAAAQMQREAAKAELDRIQESQQRAAAALPVAEAARVEGQRVKTDWAVTVTDIWLLARCHPNAVKIEPRLSEIKSLLNAGVDVKGVKAVKETTATVTTGRASSLIEV